MNKADLVVEVQKRLGPDCSRSHAERAVHALLAAIESGLRREGSVQIVGFGSFEVKARRARLGSHPRTQQPIEIRATRTIGFRPGSALREALADGAKAARPRRAGGSGDGDTGQASAGQS